MSNTIDTKSETHSYGFLLKETIKTTLTLMEASPGQFALDYDFKYSGIKNGDSQSPTPLPITGNCTVTANTNPTVIYTIANYSDSGTYISMQITITIDMSPLGTNTVFDQTLGGKYGSNNLQNMVANIAKISTQ